MSVTEPADQQTGLAVTNEINTDKSTPDSPVYPNFDLSSLSFKPLQEADIESPIPEKISEQSSLFQTALSSSVNDSNFSTSSSLNDNTSKVSATSGLPSDLSNISVSNNDDAATSSDSYVRVSIKDNRLDISNPTDRSSQSQDPSTLQKTSSQSSVAIGSIDCRYVYKNGKTYLMRSDDTMSLVHEQKKESLVKKSKTKKTSFGQSSRFVGKPFKASPKAVHVAAVQKVMEAGKQPYSTSPKAVHVAAVQRIMDAKQAQLIASPNLEPGGDSSGVKSDNILNLSSSIQQVDIHDVSRPSFKEDMVKLQMTDADEKGGWMTCFNRLTERGFRGSVSPREKIVITPQTSMAYVTSGGKVMVSAKLWEGITQLDKGGCGEIYLQLSGTNHFYQV